MDQESLIQIQEIVGAATESLRGDIADAKRHSGVLTEELRHELQLVAEGKSTKEIAGLLEISFKTVESHRARIMDKLGLHETASLVRYAIRQGLIQA